MDDEVRFFVTLPADLWDRLLAAARAADRHPRAQIRVILWEALAPEGRRD